MNSFLFQSFANIKFIKLIFKQSSKKANDNCEFLINKKISKKITKKVVLFKNNILSFGLSKIENEISSQHYQLDYFSHSYPKEW